MSEKIFREQLQQRVAVVRQLQLGLKRLKKEKMVVCEKENRLAAHLRRERWEKMKVMARIALWNFFHFLSVSDVSKGEEDV